MVENDDSDEIKDLIKKKSKLMKDPHKASELGDIVFRIGYLYYQKSDCKAALEEFEHALKIRKKLSVQVDIANTHRFIGETLCKLGTDEALTRAKQELDIYHSITLRINDLVELQRALTTLGNYYMSLAEVNYKSKRLEHLNEAYSNYLKAYDLLNEISERRLVDSKEFYLMKARTCLNCAFVTDEKRDLVICNEYLKTAIEICENNNFYEDLIRCLYIKCDQARRKNKMEEQLKTADRIIEASIKNKDPIQQTQDFLYVGDIYIKIQNFEKAKVLLRKAYKLRKKCEINPEIKQKLKHIMNIMLLQKEINSITSTLKDSEENKDSKYLKVYEKLADSYCYLGIFKMGLELYFKQLNLAKNLKRPSSEIAVIYSSIGQTYQDLEDYEKAIKYFENEMKMSDPNPKSEFKTYLNIALLKEKLRVEFEEIKELYVKALEKAKVLGDVKLQLKGMKLLKETQVSYGISCDETKKMIETLNGAIRIKREDDNENHSSSTSDSDEEEEGDNNEDDNDQSLSFSSESDDEISNNLNEEEKLVVGRPRTSVAKKSIVKRNLRGETQLHVACIKGNFKMAKSLIDEGHPVNERDNLNWLPIHEACNYGHLEIVELLIKHGAKINDSIGPITPLHDTCQNGHFEVVKLLLKAGALSYVFTSEGYTPLDFLVKYKQDNELKLTPSELTLYKELYDYMLKAIRAKDKMYKIKKVEYNDINNCLAENETEEESLVSSNADHQLSKKASLEKIRNKNERMKNLIYFDDDDEKDRYDDQKENNGESSCDEFDKRKGKKKKAVLEYKNAISNIGSKSCTAPGQLSVFTKKQLDKVIVSESDYNLNDNWLINDMNKKAVIDVDKKKSYSNKRKYSRKTDDDCSMSSEEDSDTECFQKSNEKAIKIIDNLIEKDNENRKRSKEKISPVSKKRLIEFDQNNLEMQSDLNNTDFLYTNDIINDENSNNSTESNIVITTKLKDKINNHLDLVSISDDEFDRDFNRKADDTIDITSPFRKENVQSSNVRKKQLKLTKMQNYGLKSVVQKPTEIEKFEPTKSSNQSSVVETSNSVNIQNWKIKANIDNRNFLIPIANINSTIDDLTAQIVNRYKTIFSNDPSYREPSKVILKSSDDLILFGKDLVKDVLTNLCQVQLVVESWKDAPTLSELYEQICSAKDLTIYSNIREILKNSENHSSLNLSYILKQLDIIFDVIKLNSKQQSLSSKYVMNLISIDLSQNMLNDDMCTCFIESILSECVSLKSLNLSHNILTTKSIKAINDVAHSIKMNGKLNLFPLESLNLNGNDLGCLNGNSGNNSDVILSINNILNSFQTLRILGLSDCKLNFILSESKDETYLSRLLNTIKSSNLEELNISYNRIGVKMLNDLVEHLSDKIESLNMSNCLYEKAENSFKYEERKNVLYESIVKFIPFNLRYLSLRNMNFNRSQTFDLISSLTACKQLKVIDLSYNFVDFNSIKLLFQECPKIEEAFLIDTPSDLNDNSINWKEAVSFKFDEQVNVSCLRRLEIRLSFLNDKYEIKSLFKKRWPKNTLKLRQQSKTIVEFIVT